MIAENLKKLEHLKFINPSKFPHKFEKGRIFIIKSYSDEDIHKVLHQVDLNSLRILLGN